MTEQGPKLPLDWEERAVARVFRWWRALRSRSDETPPKAASLCDRESHLHIIAQLFAGRRLHLRASEASGGIRNNVLLLPATMSAGPDPVANSELYTLRATIDGTRIYLGAKVHCGDDLLDELQSNFEACRAIQWLNQTFEGFARRLAKAGQWLFPCQAASTLSPRSLALEQLRRRVLAGNAIQEPKDLVQRFRQLEDAGDQLMPMPLWGGALQQADQAIAMEIEQSESAGARSVGSEFEAPNKDHVERIMTQPDDDAEVMPVHTFEKAECLDGFNGIMRQLDGADELEDHLEALDEVDLRHIIRGGEPAESIFHAELDGLSQIPNVHGSAPKERGILYPEWDQGQRRYRLDWVTVYPSIAQQGDDTWARERMAELSIQYRALLARLERERNAHTWIERERDGDEFVLAALIESFGDRRAGHTGDERVYKRNPRRRQNTTATVLIDISLSSDAWIANQRVLDVSRDAVLLLGEVTDALGDSMEILAFASNTRNHCRVWTVKGPREPWRVGRGRLGALVPTGYTRIGPAVRHATKGLKARRAERKLLILITDGKPNDYDRYEGSHGIADVRQAVREADRTGVRVHAIGIDPSAARALSTMFGFGRSELLRNLSDLPEVLVWAYAKET